MPPPPLLTPTSLGLFCAAGDFYIDPVAVAVTADTTASHAARDRYAFAAAEVAPVERAVLTHAHADHARAGHGRYWCAAPSLGLLERRLLLDEAAPQPPFPSPLPSLVPIPYGEPFSLGRARVSFHPSGHILGAAQVRVEADGEVWVVSGDFKRAPDPTCAPFEALRCDVFVTESTFGLPIYRWEPTSTVIAQIYEWWQQCAAQGRAAILLTYPLGKAQRILAELRAFTDRPVLLHGAMQAMVECYREAGVAMLPTAPAVPLISDDAPAKGRRARPSYAGELVLAPPSAKGSPWLRRFGDCELGFASGHMQLRGTRRRRGFDRGFVLSDHADWLDLLRTVEETGARRVLVTHGHVEALARYLRERGVDAAPLDVPRGGAEELA